MELGKILYLSGKDVEDINLPMSQIIRSLDQMFKYKMEGKPVFPPQFPIDSIGDHEDQSAQVL